MATTLAALGANDVLSDCATVGVSGITNLVVLCAPGMDTIQESCLSTPHIVYNMNKLWDSPTHNRIRALHMFEGSQSRKGLIDRPSLLQTQLTLELLTKYLSTKETSPLRDFVVAQAPSNAVDAQLTARWAAASSCRAPNVKEKGL